MMKAKCSLLFKTRGQGHFLRPDCARLLQTMKQIFSSFLILLHALLAALGGGTLAFGILELPLPWIVLIALGVALLVGALWGWALRSPLRTRLLTMLAITFVFGLGLFSLVQMRNAGQVGVNISNYRKNFEQLWQVMQAHYPYFEEKNIHWNEIYQRYQPSAQSVQTDAEYHALVANMLAELGDLHTGLVRPSPGEGRMYFGIGLYLDDGVVIDQVGDTAHAVGVARGAQILAVNGLPVEQALEALPAALKVGANSRQSRAHAAFHILSTSEDVLELTYQNPDGPAETVLLHRPQKPPLSYRQQNARPGALMSAEILPSGWGLIRIPTFSARKGQDLVAEFDQALEQVRAASGLILDLRGNGGGDSRLAERMAGRFFSQPFCYGQDRFRQRLPWRAWSLRFEYCIQPRGEIVTVGLVLLMDNRNMSSAEQFIAAFTESGRAIAIGRPSGGSSGNPLTFPLPGNGLARFSTGAFHTRSGLLVEGNGIQPDIPISYTLADFRQGRDPDLLAAQQLDPTQLFALQNPISQKESPMFYIKLFGYFLALAVLLTSMAMALMGARWQAVEQSAYAGQRRPWWFVAASLLLIGFYLFALYHFINAAPKTWAGWLLMVILPIGWGLKAALVIFNPQGRLGISAIEGDQNWRKVALARLPAALLLAVLTWFA